MINSAEEFIRLRTSDSPDDYRRAAHDQAPLDVWREIVHHHPDMKFWVVQNKSVPLEILNVLSTDEDATVRAAVAGKRKASCEILERLARDADSGVRHAVACNPKTPAQILRILTTDTWHVIAAHAMARLV